MRGGFQGCGIFNHLTRASTGSGIVEQVGDNATVAKPGYPVVLSIASCGTCGICDSGHPAHCVNHLELDFKGDKCFSSAGPIDSDISGGFFGHSSFANVTIVNQSSVVSLKCIADVDELKVIASLGCGVQKRSGSIINVRKAGPQNTVAVIGLGGVGLAAVMVRCPAQATLLIDLLIDLRLQSCGDVLRLLESTALSLA